MTVNNIDLYMQFKFGLNNGSMAMKIYQDKDLIREFSNVKEDLVIFETSIRMGCQLRILLSDKFPRDTTVKDGKIIADKFIQLQEMRLGRIPVSEFVLFQICNYQANNQIFNNTYWGFNGQITMSFPQDNFIKWHLKHNNKFEY